MTQSDKSCCHYAALQLVVDYLVDSLDRDWDVVVEAGDGVAEVDRGVAGEAGGTAEHASFTGGAG